MSEAPGLKRRPRADGTVAYYWVAAAVSRKASDYPLKTFRLNATTEEEAATQCRRLSAELREWLSAPERSSRRFDGTMASLIAIYQTDTYSPYRKVRENTRNNYDHSLRVLERAVGARRISMLHRHDFAKWYEEFRAPKVMRDENGAEVAGPERIRNAHGLLTMVRTLLKFGASMELAGCHRALTVISLMEFEHPRPRRITMTYGQAAGIVDEALKRGRRSIALAQALQFELTLRQADVIGMWSRESVSGISRDRWYWSKGVTWGDLANGTILPKETSKTGQLGEWDLSRYPLIVRVLSTFPGEERVGPMIVDESTGQPYLNGRFARVWREIADAAGVPKEIWNRDSRSGGLTEASEAGAAAPDLQKLATHTNYQTTSRYLRHGLDATNRVADLRVARRQRERKDYKP